MSEPLPPIAIHFISYGGFWIALLIFALVSGVGNRRPSSRESEGGAFHAASPIEKVGRQ